MTGEQMSTYIRDLQNKFSSIETWALTVNDAIGDHAFHIDHAKTRIESFSEHGRKVSTELGQVKSDVKEFARQAVESDSVLKASVASVVQLLSSEVDKLNKHTAEAFETLDKKMSAGPETRLNAIEAQLRAGSAGGASVGEPTTRLNAIEAQLISRTDILRDQGNSVAARVSKIEHFIAEGARSAVPPQPTSAARVADPFANGADPWAQPASAQARPANAQGSPQHFDMGSNIGNMGGNGGQAGSGGQTGGQTGDSGHGGFGGFTSGVGGFGNGAGGACIKVNMDLKIATQDKHIYSDAHPEAWHKEIRKYLIGRHPDMKAFLNWIEGQGHNVITDRALRESSAMCDVISFDPVQVSQELWSWLNMTLGKSSHANRQFNLTEELNGADAYRRLVAPQTTTSIIKRNALRDKIQNPQRSKSMAAIMEFVALWEEDSEAFIKAGGSAVSEEDRCAQLMKILPHGLSFEIMSKADDESKSGSAKLIDWMRAKSAFISDYSDKELHVAAADTPSRPPLPPPRYEDHDYDDNSDDNNIDISQMSDDELLAFVRNGGGNFGGNNRRTARPQARRNDRRDNGRTGGQTGRLGGRPVTRFGTQPPPRDRADIRCINCGGHGHSWRSCPNPEVPREKRPCLKCGKPGHLSADCPDNKQTRIVEGTCAASSPQRTFEIKCVEGDGGDGDSRQRGKPFSPTFDSSGFQIVKGGFIPKPSGVSIGSWIAPSNNSFQVTTTRNRFSPLTLDKINQFDSGSSSKLLTKRPQVRPESVEDLPPATEDGRLGISRVISPNKREAETQSRNSVAETSSVVLAAMAELDRREAAASTRPMADTQTDNKFTDDNFP